MSTRRNTAASPQKGATSPRPRERERESGLEFDPFTIPGLVPLGGAFLSLRLAILAFMARVYICLTLLLRTCRGRLSARSPAHNPAERKQAKGTSLAHNPGERKGLTSTFIAEKETL